MTFLGWSGLEWLANIVYTASVILAARNSIHTWWTGIIGCLLLTVALITTILQQ